MSSLIKTSIWTTFNKAKTHSANEWTNLIANKSYYGQSNDRSGFIN